jgi:hypothetical protein
MKHSVKITVVPQDMGRVILNLITNAFYVVSEKKQQAAAGYEPTVIVGTRKKGNAVEIFCERQWQWDSTINS